MNESVNRDRTHLLQQLMQQVGVSSFKDLHRTAGVSLQQVMRLRRGQVLQMRVETLVKISQVLQVSVSELLTTFGDIKPGGQESQTALKQEYQRLLAQLEQQRKSLRQEFQHTSLQVLESWLLQWPSAAYAARQNPQLPAARLLPLLRPMEQLLQQWGVEAIATVGDEIPYNPQWHQLMEGTVGVDELVRVRYVGYRQGDKLLHRAKVSPLRIEV